MLMIKNLVMPIGTKQKNKHLSRGHSVAAGVLFLMVLLMFFAQQAFAAPPKGDWIVGPIYASASSGKSFCSMKNSYDNGYSVVFARDATGSNSIALSFTEKKALAAGSQYYATFSVGPIRRMMISIAATTQVLITQMGDDPDFYDMLGRKNALYVEFNGQELVFGLAGTGKALEQLTACAAAVSLGDNFASVNVPALQAVRADIDDERVADDMPLPKVDPPKKAVTAVAADALKQNRDLQLSEQALGSSLLAEVERLRREKERLQRENQAISARLHTSDLEAAQIEAARMAEFERKERALLIENARLKERLASRQGAGMPAPVAEKVTNAAPAVSATVAPVTHEKPQPADLATWVRMAVGAPAQLEAASTESGIRAWRWQNGDIFIAVQELPIMAGQMLDRAAADYVATVRTRCGGDFAHKFSGIQHVQGVDAMTGEMACIDDTQDAAAGLAFVAKDNRMVVVTYESATDAMSDMLSKRDIFISKVYSGQFAL